MKGFRVHELLLKNDGSSQSTPPDFKSRAWIGLRYLSEDETGDMAFSIVEASLSMVWGYHHQVMPTPLLIDCFML